MFERLVPTVFYRDPMAALRWLQQAFGFEVSLAVTDADGRLGHAEMSIGGSNIGVGAEWSDPQLLGPAALKSPASLEGASTQFIWVRLEEGLDDHCERARAGGARIVQAPEDQFYGDRTYRALDLEGHVWGFRQPVRTLTLQQMEQASGLKLATSLPEI